MALFFLCSCQTGKKWNLDFPNSPLHSPHFSRLTFPSDSPYQGIEVEIACLEENQEVYLNSSCLAFPYLKDFPKCSEVTIETEEGERNFYAYRFDGGQRLKLSEEGVHFLIHSLNQCQKVIIRVGVFKVDFSTNIVD